MPHQEFECQYFKVSVPNLFLLRYYFSIFFYNMNRLCVQNLIRVNEQKIKLFISQCEQPIPDIVNQPQQSIYSHFRFYFNDDQLMLQQNYEAEGIISLIHHKNFQTEINQIFEQWIHEKITCAENREAINKLQKNYNMKNFQEQNHKSSEQSVKYQNFIAFVQYWIRKSPNLKISYTLYDQIVHECVESFFDNAVNLVSFSFLPKDFKPFKLKNDPKKENKSKQKSEKCSSLVSNIALKRLNIYFNHFSKMKNLSVGSSNFTSNGSKTFDEIGQFYSTVNLQQWICFIKAFNFDKIFQQNHKNKAKQVSSSPKKVNNKQYLPVKYIKWNTSLHYFKNLFEKHCDNLKQLNFQSFQDIIKKLFIQLFSKSDKTELIPIQHNENFQPQNLIFSQNQSNGQSLKAPCAFTPQQIGIGHLKLSSQEQFNNKLRGLGIFVPTQVTHINLSNNEGTSLKSKSYSHIKQKYLKIQPLPTMSPNKIKQGLLHNKLSNKNDLILPSLTEQGKNKLKKYYTISQLMANNQKINSLEKQQQKQKINEQRVQIDKQNKRMKKEQGTAKQKRSHQIVKNKIQVKQQAKSNCISIETNIQCQQPDQFLRKYYDKKNGVEYKTPLLAKNLSNSVHYSGGSHARKENASYDLGKNLNLLKRIDERIQKINKKML